MNPNEIEKVQAIMQKRFSHGEMISLATAVNNIPSVRDVNAFYEEGAFYLITDARTNKVRQIEANPAVAVSGTWFTGHGTAENLGWLRAEKNADTAAKVRTACAEWLTLGHVDEMDENTVILRIRLTDGVLAENDNWYEVDFTELFPG